MTPTAWGLLAVVGLVAVAALVVALRAHHLAHYAASQLLSDYPAEERHQETELLPVVPPMPPLRPPPTAERRLPPPGSRLR